MLTAVVLTYNEEENIEDCIASLYFCDEVVVIDSGSSDSTCKRAKTLGATVYTRSFDNFANQRNFALTDCPLKNDWVLHMDADERVCQNLASEIIQVISHSSSFDAYRVPFMTYLGNKPLKHAGMYPRFQTRLGKKDRLRFVMVGHGQREDMPLNEVGTLKNDIIHYNFSKGIGEWIFKHSRYALAEAQALIEASSVHNVSVDFFSLVGDAGLRRRFLKGLIYQMPFRPLLVFVYVFFVRLGVLDGRPGFQYSILLSIYQWLIDYNTKELRNLSRTLHD